MCMPVSHSCVEGQWHLPCSHPARPRPPWRHCEWQCLPLCGVIKWHLPCSHPARPRPPWQHCEWQCLPVWGDSDTYLVVIQPDLCHLRMAVSSPVWGDNDTYLVVIQPDLSHPGSIASGSVFPCWRRVGAKAAKHVTDARTRDDLKPAPTLPDLPGGNSMVLESNWFRVTPL